MPLLASFMRTIIAGGIMAVILDKLLFSIHFLILIPIGAIIYFVILFSLAELKKDDIKSFLRSFSPKI